MRILFISNYYPPYEIGGYEQLCRDVAELMSKRGHQVAVLTSDWGTENSTNLVDANIYRRLKLQRLYGGGYGSVPRFFLERKSVVQENLRRLAEVLDDYRPEIVFIWNLQNLPREVAIACERRRNLVVAYWLAGYTPAEPDEYWCYWESLPTNRALRLLKQPLRRAAQRIMTKEGKPIRPGMKSVAVVSHFMLEKGLAEGTLPAHAQVIYNGVEFDRYCRPVQPKSNGKLRLLQAGRVTRDKGVHTSLEAARRLFRAGKGALFELVIAGKGPANYIAELETYVGENSLQDNVTILGWLPREEMPSLMAKFHVLLLPTEHPEPFARVMLEGMAAGLTVIGSRTGGTEELLRNGTNGLTFEAGDSRELAKLVSALLEHDDLRQQLAVAGQKQVKESYTLEVMVNKVEQFLEESKAGSSLAASETNQRRGTAKKHEIS